MHINAIGRDCSGKTEPHPDVSRAGHVVVKYEPQTRIEGELQQMPDDFSVQPLWQVLENASPGRQSARDITLFESVGFALEGFSSLRYIHKQAQKRNIDIQIAQIPVDDDPKDLFGRLRDRPARIRRDAAAAP